jgi:hypothetical protein
LTKPPSIAIKRIDALETDALAIRGLLHEHSLAVQRLAARSGRHPCAEAAAGQDQSRLQKNHRQNAEPRARGRGRRGAGDSLRPPYRQAPGAMQSLALRQPLPPEPGHEWLSTIDPQTGRRALDQPSAAQEVGSRWPMLDRSPLYSAMQREMTHKIEAKGKMTVDVSAPSGTQVGADFDSLFTDLEINRQIQMEPAGTTARRPTIYGPN